MRGKGRRTKKKSWPLSWHRWSQPSPALTPGFCWLWLEDSLPSPRLSAKIVYEGRMEVRVSDCPKIGVWKNSRAIRYLKSATGSSGLSVSLPTTSRGAVQRRAKLDPGGSIPGVFSVDLTQPKASWERWDVSAEARGDVGRSPGRGPRTVPGEGRQGCRGHPSRRMSALGRSCLSTVEPALGTAPSDVTLSVQDGWSRNIRQGGCAASLLCDFHAMRLPLLPAP